MFHYILLLLVICLFSFCFALLVWYIFVPWIIPKLQTITCRCENVPWNMTLYLGVSFRNHPNIHIFTWVHSTSQTFVKSTKSTTFPGIWINGTYRRIFGIWGDSPKFMTSHIMQRPNNVCFPELTSLIHLVLFWQKVRVTTCLFLALEGLEI